ncbi:unnamed protein product [Mytilus edulis]|uniref:DUF1758 domain-containing protein n=1 Tax=Mytilus edulis TaxID=6550 RepID=A0A8S3QKD1_MYTED|nr:unnamed protein product [Mytilus edulis]
MTTLSHMKGVRTRYRNTLYTEIQEGNSILHAEISKPHRQEMVHKSAKCIEKLKVYINKLEIQSSKVASSLEEDQSGTADKLADEDCKLCSDATDCYLELENFKERLVDNIKLETTENVEKVNPSDFIQLQQEMKDIIQTQLKQQEEFIKSQQKSESAETNVKLPKIDIISFNGDKTKWNEFWDSFESTIDQNKRLSNIDKFNYLKSKLVGDAKYAISGLNVSHENYIVAVNILKERFGNTQDVIDLHYCEMINLQCPSNKTYSLRLFIDKVNRHLRSLEVLKQSVDQDIFVSMVRSKLPQEVMLQLEIQKGTTEKWCVKSLCARLMDYVVAKERSDKSDVQKDRQNSQNNNGANSLSKRNQFQGKFSKFQNGSRQFPNRSTAEALVVNGNDTSQSSSYFDKCRFCQGKHWSDQCPKYKTIDERKAQLKGSCYKCFRNTHKSAECKKGKLCVHCGVLNSHHRSLCPKKFGPGLTSVHLSEEYDHSSSGLSSGVEQSLTSLSEQRETASENVLISSSEIVLMQTAKVEVSNPNDSLKQTTRLLFDSGSQRTYISQKLASKLKLKSEGDEEITIVTFGSEKARTVKTASTSLCIRLNNGKVLKISANIVPVISGTVQRRRLDTSSIENVRHFVKDVELADVIPTQYETSTVDLLIGNDHYFDFILGQRIEIQPGLYILASKLGWIITGRTKENDYSREDIESSFLIMSYTGSNVPKTDTCITSVPNVTDLWNLESIGISDDDNSTEDSRVLEMFKETLEYSNGRYYVTWPWKNDNVDLPVNRDLALSRLKSCIARMRKKPELLEKYNSVIQDQLDKGIVEKVEEHSTEGLKHYIPHHAVITPNKTTTKLRIVYDASAKPNNEVNSLNECLYRGPVLLRNLCGIFMRFRLNQVAIVADIEKAFQ